MRLQTLLGGDAVEQRQFADWQLKMSEGKCRQRWAHSGQRPHP